MTIVYVFPNGFAKQAESMYGWLRHYGMNPRWANCKDGKTRIKLPNREVSQLVLLQKTNPAMFGNVRQYPLKGKR